MNEAIQGSAAWLFARVGHCTASRFDAVIAKKKDGKPKQERENYLYELVIERLTGNPSDHWTSAAMLWGTEHEPLARMAYEAFTGHIVEQVGFVTHPTIDLCGGSADGLIDEDGGWECKCPFNSMYHLQTISGGMPAEHMAQVQGNIWINNRQWFDFSSFDPRMPEPLQLYIERVVRDDKYIATLEAEVITFLAEVAATYAGFKP